MGIYNDDNAPCFPITAVVWDFPTHLTYFTQKIVFLVRKYQLVLQKYQLLYENTSSSANISVDASTESMAFLNKALMSVDISVSTVSDRPL